MVGTEWVKGRVRKLFEDRGYGFIDASLGPNKDVFFHLKHIDRLEREFLKEGVEVKFQLEQNGERLRAHRVSLLFEKTQQGATK
jgi:cold shock CspA family protein